MTSEHGSEFVPEHDRAIEELEAALHNQDIGTIEVARRLFMQTRQALLRWVTNEEVEAECNGGSFTPSPEVKDIMDRDHALYERLLSLDKTKEDELRLKARARDVQRNVQKPAALPRAIHKKPLTVELIRKASRSIGEAQKLVEQRNIVVHQREYLELMVPIIECALALDAYTGDVQELLGDDAEMIEDTYARWRRIMATFADELRTLAADRSEDNRGNWQSACIRIGQAYFSEASIQSMREVALEGNREEQQKRKKKG